jgi:hypothetical protein
MNGVTIINIHAPAGKEKRKEREQFYNKDINYLLQQPQEYTIIASDFVLLIPKTVSDFPR